MKQITGLLPNEITEELNLSRTYHGKQIFKWIHSGVESFSQMTNISKDLRTFLSEQVDLFSSKISREITSGDGTVKITLQLADGIFIEAVLLEDERGRRTACISSQAGCAMGCTFCRTGTMGLLRNLEAGEIVEQYILLQNRYGKISNIVFMGMGEPLANLENVRKAITIFHHPDGPNIGMRKITISTCGIISGIDDLTQNGPPVKLAISLVSADSRTRTALMPITGTNPLSELKQCLSRYQKVLNKRFTLEYVLLGGINDTIKDAEGVRHFLGNMKAVVNVIPWNPAETLPFKEPSEERVAAFIKRLEELGVSTTRRYRRGRGINGACGQLAVLENTTDPSYPCR